MLRFAVIAAVFAACASAAAQDRTDVEQGAPWERRQAEEIFPEVRHDGFVRSGDECGASRFAHLVGEQYAELHHAALPADSNVVDGRRLTTLEYTPARLNVVVNHSGRIVAIGCF